jgi:peptidoglycan hydrolase-like protein with peptidoglycan-binding domain
MSGRFDAPDAHPTYPISSFVASPRLAAWVFAGLAGALVIGTLPNDGAAADGDGTNRAAPVNTTAAPPTTSAPSTTTTIPDPTASHALVQPAPAVLPPVPPEGLGPGDSGDVVKAYEERMADVRLDPGPRDGVYNEATTYAVDTVQRLMDVKVTGRIGPEEAAFIAGFHYPEPLHPDAERNRTEIDVTKQVMTLYHGYQVQLVTMISTGSGATYCFDSPKAAPIRHVCAIANTPSGRFTYYYRFSGVQDGASARSTTRCTSSAGSRCMVPTTCRSHGSRSGASTSRCTSRTTSHRSCPSAIRSTSTADRRRRSSPTPRSTRR